MMSILEKMCRQSKARKKLGKSDTYILYKIRKDLNYWYDNLDDETKLELELLGDDYEQN